MITIENSSYSSLNLDAESVKKISIKEEIAIKSKKRKLNYPCEFCELSFSRKDRLDLHLFSHTGIKQFKCKFAGCSKEFRCDSHLRRHVRISHDFKPVPCREATCKEVFQNIKTMHEHFRQSHYKNDYFPCVECDEHFRRKLKLRVHMLEVHQVGNYKFVCAHCEEGFFSRPIYSRHLASHQKVKSSRPCPNCELTFEKWSDLVKHRREAHKVRQTGRFFCDLCPNFFTWKKSLRYHMRTHETNRVRHFKCEYENCRKQYTTKSNLKAHIRSKHKNRNFECKYCGLELSTKQRHKQHVDGHLIGKEVKQSTLSLILGLQVEPVTNKLNLPPPPKIEVPTESEISD